MTDFKVGDKVVGVKHHDGETGVVFQPGHSSMYVYVKLDDGGSTGVFRLEELKLLEPEEFKVGDIVKVKPGGFTYNAHENKTLIVDGLRDEKNRYRYKVRALGEDHLPGHDYLNGELEAGEELAEWEIELLDHRSPKLEEAKAAHPSNGKLENDPVNNPSHYTQYPVEVIELTRHMPFDEGNVVKYVARSPFKGNKVQDLKKARFYLDDAIKLAEAELAAAE